MKIALFIIPALFIHFIGLAQHEGKITAQKQKTLFKNARPIGGFIGFSAKPAELNNQDAFFGGAQVAIGLGRKVNLGVVGYGLISNNVTNQFDNNGNRYFLEMGYGGLLIEPIIGSNRMIHLTAPVVLGAGASVLSRYRPWEVNNNYNTSDYVSEEAFFIAEPSINAELNVFKIMRLGAGIGYRFVSPTGILNSNGIDLNGWTANVTLKLGWF